MTTLQDRLRGTGRTTRQIQNAPRNAFYISYSQTEADLYKRIAYHAERYDLTFLALTDLMRMRGARRPIVVDHHVWEVATGEERDKLVAEIATARPRPPIAPARAERFARKMHETYERLAPQFHYETRPETREFNPDSVNGRLMIAVAYDMLQGFERGEL